MDSPHLLYGMARPHDPYFAHSYATTQSRGPLIDPSGLDSNIDPSLGYALPATSAISTGALGHPHREGTAFFNTQPVQSPQLQAQQHLQHQSVLPSTFQIPFQQPRWGSPVSSYDRGSSCNSALSPAGDSDVFHEIGPATPPAGVDCTVAPSHHLKYQPAGCHTPPQTTWGSPRLLIANDQIAAPCVTAGYVDPSQINPASQADFDFYAAPIPIDYDFGTPQRSLTLQSSSSIGLPSLDANNTSTTVETFSVPIKQEDTITAAYYPPSPFCQESVDSETEHPRGLKRSRSADQDDGEYDEDGDDSSNFAPAKPIKSVKTRSRAAASPKKKPAPRRPSKPASQSNAAPPSPKRQRRKSSKAEVDLASSSSSSSSSSSITSASMASSPGGSGVMLTQAGPGHLTCRDCPQAKSFKTEGALETHVKKQHKRPFVCVFAFAGCESNFASKNEWKRHVLSQHILLKFWVCTQDDCAKTVNMPPVLAPAPSSSGGQTMTVTSPTIPVRASSSLRGRNSCAIAPASSLTAGSGVAGHHPKFGPPLPNGAIFNRKDLYTQHVRRMHAPDRNRQQQRPGGPSSSSLPIAVAPVVVPHGRRSSSSSTVTVAAAVGGDGEALAWEEVLRQMQCDAERDRCRLPTRMQCPAPGCATAFEGDNAWDERMEHLAKHLEAAARGDQPVVPLAGGGGGEPDRSLIEWASRPNVAIIVPCAGGGRGAAGTTQWVLNNPLKPSGAAVMAITAAAAAAATAAAASFLDNPTVLDEIIVERADEDAEGEDDDGY
ncbi:hypothetical protein RB593_003538 [Gaeumannomyces tritici]